MRQKKIISVVSFLMLLAGCNQATKPASNDSGTPGQQSGTSTFSSSPEEGCGLRIAKVNTRFSLTTLYFRDADDHQVLLKERFEENGCTNAEKLQGIVSVEGWIDQFDAARAPSWRLETDGDQGEFDQGFYKVTTLGCCGATNAAVYFNLMTGKKIFESAVDLVEVEVPNTDNSRYVAFLDTWSVLNPEEAKSDSSVKGALEYGSAQGPAERVLLVSSGGGPFHAKELTAASIEKPVEHSNRLQLWAVKGSKDPSAISFRIRLNLVEVANDGREFTIVVPVDSDRLDLEHAELPEGLQLRRSRSR